MKLVVTGGRDYPNRARVYEILDEIHQRCIIHSVAHGAAGTVDMNEDRKPMVEVINGADLLAGEWAVSRQVFNHPYPVTPSDWRRLGKKAGPLRNGRMLATEKPDLVVAFPGGKGTADCVKQARAMKIQVLEVKDV